MIGTIIGAGVFALPAMFARLGLWPATAIFIVVTGAVLGMHLLYVQIATGFKENRRLAGYAKEVLGTSGSWVATVTYPLAEMGGLFAYLVLGGEFLASLSHQLGFGGTVVAWQLLFWFVGAVTVLFGLKAVAKVEAWVTWLLIATMVVVSVLALQAPVIERVAFYQWSELLTPFGIFLFSMFGLSVVGEVVDMTRPNKRIAMQAVMIGTLVSAVLSWVFAVSLFLTKGFSYGRGASALTEAMPLGWQWMIPLFGFLAVLTSFITVAQDLKATWHLDFRVSKPIAWMLALGAPLLLLSILKRDFLATLDFVGAIFWSVNGMLVALIALKTIKQRKVSSWWWAYAIPWFILVVFAVGFLQKLWYHQAI